MAAQHQAPAPQTRPDAGVTAARRWHVSTWLLGAVMAAALSASVLAIPVQVTDSIVPLLQAEQMPSVVAAMRASTGNQGYFRPLRIGQIQVLYALSGGAHYTAVFKGFHVLLVVALVAGFVAVLRVRSASDFLVAVFSMTVLTGHHTFLGTVWEAYPINHFLEIGVFCVFALVLARSRGGWWVDGLAALTFTAAALTLESGLLVWVVLVAAWLAGWRGVSGRAIGLVSALLCAYAYVRFVHYSAGVPTLIERESGFWTARLSTDELVQRFGANPRLFYAYNVVSSFIGVLFAEPRAGVYTIPLQWQRDGMLAPATLVTVFTSLVTTAVMAWAVVSRVPGWCRAQFDDAGRFLFVALAVVGANAVISYGYTKDEIMSPGGIFYALGAFAAVRHVVESARGRAAASVGGVLMAVALFTVAAGWVVRDVGTHYNMHRMASLVRNEWVAVDGWLEKEESTPTTQTQRRIVQVLRDDAVTHPGFHAFFFPLWAERWLLH
ncbi:MAG TPA: hypothetical protein VIY56_03835 [Vicinamibacterales bacterium]